MDERGLKARQMPGPLRKPRADVLIGGEETGGRFAVVETVEEPGSQSLRHLHHWEDEALYVLEGGLKVWVVDRWVDAPAGTAVFLPRGAEHAYVVAAKTARMLIFLVPAGFEKFYREVGATGSAPLDVERLVATAARYGCEVTGPTPEITG